MVLPVCLENICGAMKQKNKKIQDTKEQELVNKMPKLDAYFRATPSTVSSNVADERMEQMPITAVDPVVTVSQTAS